MARSPSWPATGLVAGGSTVTLSDQLNSPTTQVTTGPLNDTVLVHQLPYNTVLSVNTGGGANDLLSIDGVSGHEAWTITAQGVNVQTNAGLATINYKNVGNLIINAKPGSGAGDDTFVVNGTSASTAPPSTRATVRTALRSTPAPLTARPWKTRRSCTLAARVPTP